MAESTAFNAGEFGSVNPFVVDIHVLDVLREHEPKVAARGLRLNWILQWAT